jgi:hypothetical protein
MICELRMTTEMLTDLFTPGVLTLHKCVKGLPVGVELFDIVFDKDTKNVSLFFQNDERLSTGEEMFKSITVTFEGDKTFISNNTIFIADKHSDFDKAIKVVDA